MAGPNHIDETERRRREFLQHLLEKLPGRRYSAEEIVQRGTAAYESQKARLDALHPSAPAIPFNPNQAAPPYGGPYKSPLL